MRPLNLDKISKMTNLHISTVSRSIQNKFIETPRGTFEMKYFFDKGTYGEEQDMQISSKTIENIIKELIKNETPSNILSDDKIVNIQEETFLSYYYKENSRGEHSRFISLFL